MCPTISPIALTVSGVSIYSNLPGLRAHGAFTTFTRQLNATMERLATGKQINRAADDPSGVQAVSQMKARLVEMNKRVDRLAFEDAYLGAREGAQSALSDLLLELQSTVTSAANTGALTPAEKDALQIQAESTIKAIDFLSQTTTFNGEQILTGFHSSKLGTTTAQVPNGVDADGNPITRTQTYSLHDLLGAGDLNLISGNLEKAQEVITGAVKGVAESRGAIGRQMQANASERRLLASEIENTESARSQIEDADFAKETSNLIREQTLQQASLFIMQFAAEQKEQMVKSLLEGSSKTS